MTESLEPVPGMWQEKYRRESCDPALLLGRLPQDIIAAHQAEANAIATEFRESFELEDALNLLPFREMNEDTLLAVLDWKIDIGNDRVRLDAERKKLQMRIQDAWYDHSMNPNNRTEMERKHANKLKLYASLRPS